MDEPVTGEQTCEGLFPFMMKFLIVCISFFKPSTKLVLAFLLGDFLVSAPVSAPSFESSNEFCS